MTDAYIATRAGRRWWREGPPVLWEQLGELAVAFDPATGETHFLTELPALILPAIGAAPETPDDLLARIAGPLTLDDDALMRVMAALDFLEAAELVESQAAET